MVSTLPNVRDRPPMGPDLATFRELLATMRDHIESSLWADLVRYFDAAARVVECVLADNSSVDSDLVALSAVSRRLDAYLGELASREVQDPRLQVSWKDIEERMELVRMASIAP